MMPTERRRHQPPDRADDDRRDDQRQGVDGAEEALAGKLAHEELGEQVADDDLAEPTAKKANFSVTQIE